MARLGLGLNLGKKRSTAWQAAAAAGGGADWLAEHKRLARRVSRIDPTSVKGTRIAEFMKGGQTPWQNPSTPAATAPPAGTPDSTTPTPTGGTTGGSGQTAPNKPLTMSEMAERFAIKTPQELEAVSQFAMGNLPKVAQFDNSAYEEQFNRLMQQSREEGDVNAAKIAEAYGSRGARYGSDIGRESADMRRKQTLDLMTKGYDVRQGLNDRRLTELQGTIGALSNVGASQGNILQTGMQNMWNAYGIDMQPPAMWDEMMGFAQSFDTPGHALY